MATTVLTSIPCATEDMARSSLGGSLAEHGKGGHSVSVREIKAEEGPHGWIATAIIDIEDLEEEEDDEPHENISEASEAEKIIEKENALFEMTHAIRSSDAKDAFPEVEPVEPNIEQQDTTTAGGGESHDRGNALNSADEDIIGIDQNRTELGEALQNDFADALDDEVPPPETVPDGAFIDPVGGMPAMTAQQLKEAQEKERRRHREAMEFLAEGHNVPDDGPVPTLQE